MLDSSDNLEQKIEDNLNEEVESKLSSENQEKIDVNINLENKIWDQWHSDNLDFY